MEGEEIERSYNHVTFKIDEKILKLPGKNKIFKVKL